MPPHAGCLHAVMRCVWAHSVQAGSHLILCAGAVHPCAVAAQSACMQGCTLPSSDAEQHICAQVPVAAPSSTLWAVLTDFEALSATMPNVECSKLPGSAPGMVLLQQRMFSQTVFWRVEASARLKVRLRPSTDGGTSTLEFAMLAGDFRTLFGRWVVTPDPESPGAGCTLQYEIVFQPTREVRLPKALQAFLLEKTLPSNIAALASAAERKALVRNA